jgi:hypothetical protein
LEDPFSQKSKYGILEEVIKGFSDCLIVNQSQKITTPPSMKSMRFIF